MILKVMYGFNDDERKKFRYIGNVKEFTTKTIQRAKDNEVSVLQNFLNLTHCTDQENVKDNKGFSSHVVEIFVNPGKDDEVQILAEIGDSFLMENGKTVEHI